MNNLIERLLKLFSVKSIVTIAMTALFGILAVRGIIDGDKVNTIFTTIIAFYFGTQAVKE